MSSTRDKLEPFRRLVRAVPGGMVLGRWLRRTIDPELSTIHQLVRTKQGRLFQPFPDTCEERYPALFDALAEPLAGLPRPRILSFGCSSGAEVRALRLRLPQAQITGIDLNPRALEAEKPEDCSSTLPFARFEQGIAALDGCLVPGGWLAIYNSHFRFTDTAAAANYSAAPVALNDTQPPEVLYGPDNRRLPASELLPGLFRKHG